MIKIQIPRSHKIHCGEYILEKRTNQWNTTSMLIRRVILFLPLITKGRKAPKNGKIDKMIFSVITLSFENICCKIYGSDAKLGSLPICQSIGTLKKSKPHHKIPTNEKIENIESFRQTCVTSLQDLCCNLPVIILQGVKSDDGRS